MKTKSKPEPPKQTFINWISVHEELPSTGQKVIVLTEYQEVATTFFNPESGWNCSQGAVKFWSPYNLPK